MKKYLFYLTAIVLFAAGCKQDEISRITPTGDFNVYFDFPSGVITAPTKLILVNRSRFSDRFLWEFPQGKILTRSGILDTSSSTKIIPDTIVYAIPGTYSVTLTAWQGGKMELIKRDIIVTKMRPRIVVPENLLINNEFQFRSFAFKFPDKNITFSWDFDEPGLTSTAQNPLVTFARKGAHNVTLTVNDGEETLITTVVIDVKGELAKALYFTDAVTNKLYKYSLIVDESARVVEELNATTGINPFGLNVYNGRLYVNEAGNIVRFPSGSLPETVAWQNGDGRIYSTNLEGNNRVNITQNTQLFAGAGTGFQVDPFNHTIDQSGVMFFVIRNNGIRTINTREVEAQYPGPFITPVAADNGGAGISTWIDGSIKIVNNQIWLSKASSNGRGIFVYNRDRTFSRRIAINSAVKSFVVDSINNRIYFTNNFGTAKGLFRCDLNGSNVQLIDDLVDFSTQGGLNEQTYVTGMDIDINPGSASGGFLYLGFRHNDTIRDNVAPANPNGSLIVPAQRNKSGIYRYALNGSNAKTFIVQGYAPFGIALDHVLR